MDNRIKQMQEIFGCEEESQKTVKMEKKDKGLFRKTDECTVLLTEDNKMMLND